MEIEKGGEDVISRSCEKNIEKLDKLLSYVKP